MATTHALARLKAIKKLLFSTSERMGTSSPQDVLKNFIDMLKSASPQLKLAIALLTPWVLLLSAISRYAWLSNWCGKIHSYVSDWLYASVSIPAAHPLNRLVLSFMVEHGLGRNARTLALTAPGISSTSYRDVERMLYGNPYDIHGRRLPAGHSSHRLKEDNDPDKKALSYVPEVGRYTFWWKWHRMTFERKVNMHEEFDSRGKLKYSQALTGDETIVISTTSPFSGAKPIQDFLQHIKAVPAKDSTTTIYRPNMASMIWDGGISRPSRNLNAVTLDSKVKDELVKDIQTYLSPATRKYYANRGIPYRRGFLFYGNPGCGKTSFTNALAGHFGLNVYMFSLSTTTLTDDILELLFEQLPSRCIVLLEDIDSAGLKRESMRATRRKKSSKQKKLYYDEFGSPVYPGDEEEVASSGVTLSGLLNVLDGIHSKEGMLTIMTSNSPDSLDPALVRPGRIDRKVLFGYCSKEVLTKLFIHIFEKAPEELVDGESISDDMQHVTELAEAFAEKIPADKLTPAEVQGFLLVHRDDPQAAVNEVAEWASKTIDRKASGANVDTFVCETQLGEDDEDEDDGDDTQDSAIDVTEGAEGADPFVAPFGDVDPAAASRKAKRNAKKHGRATAAGLRSYTNTNTLPVQLPIGLRQSVQSFMVPPPPPSYSYAMPASVSLGMPTMDIPTPPISRSSSHLAMLEKQKKQIKKGKSMKKVDSVMQMRK